MSFFKKQNFILVTLILIIQLLLFEFYSLYKTSYDSSNSIIQNIQESGELILETPQTSSCLNDIFDKIFVISIERRMKTLALTLFQLNNENINYTLWEGHSADNNYSIDLHHKFKNKLDTEIINEHKKKRTIKEIRYMFGRNSAYSNKIVFFLRQTKIDIVKYSKKHNLSKILILEDDLLLANPKWIKLFCATESYLPNWFLMSLGINQGQPDLSPLMNISKFENKPIKYFYHNYFSNGGFAIAFQSQIYQILIDLLDSQTTNRVFALDNWEFVNGNLENKGFIKKGITIHPGLFLPDVTQSDIRKSRDIFTYLNTRSTDHNASHYSKYWRIRFNETNYNYSTGIKEQIIVTQTDTNTLWKELIRNSPSNLYLHRQWY